MAAIYQTLLDEIEADDFQVLQHRIRLTPLRKFWIAWTTARRERSRHRRYLKKLAHA
jgi:phytoene synthase